MPPSNDAFSAAIALASTTDGSTTGSNVDATIEANEPSPDAIGELPEATVWWKWTAPQAGSMVFDTNGSLYVDPTDGNLDSVLAIYTGSGLGALVEVASDDDSGTGPNSRLTFDAVAGTTYYIQVGGYPFGDGSTRGSIVLTWSLEPEPPPPPPTPSNDLIRNAIIMEGSFGTSSGTTDGATSQPGEWSYPSYLSVWWVWHANADYDRMFFDFSGSAPNTFPVTVWESVYPPDSVTLPFLYPSQYRGSANIFNNGDGTYSVSLTGPFTNGNYYYFQVVGQGDVNVEWSPLASIDVLLNASLPTITDYPLPPRPPDPPQGNCPLPDRTSSVSVSGNGGGLTDDGRWCASFNAVIRSWQFDRHPDQPAFTDQQTHYTAGSGRSLAHATVNQMTGDIFWLEFPSSPPASPYSYDTPPYDKNVMKWTRATNTVSTIATLPNAPHDDTIGNTLRDQGWWGLVFNVHDGFLYCAHSFIYSQLSTFLGGSGWFFRQAKTELAQINPAGGYSIIHTQDYYTSYNESGTPPVYVTSEWQFFHDTDGVMWGLAEFGPTGGFAVVLIRWDGTTWSEAIPDPEMFFAVPDPAGGVRGYDSQSNANGTQYRVTCTSPVPADGYGTGDGGYVLTPVSCPDNNPVFLQGPRPTAKGWRSDYSYIVWTGGFNVGMSSFTPLPLPTPPWEAVMYLAVDDEHQHFYRALRGHQSGWNPDRIIRHDFPSAGNQTVLWEGPLINDYHGTPVHGGGFVQDIAYLNGNLWILNQIRSHGDPAGVAQVLGGPPSVPMSPTVIFESVGLDLYTRLVASAVTNKLYLVREAWNYFDPNSLIELDPDTGATRVLYVDASQTASPSIRGDLSIDGAGAIWGGDYFTDGMWRYDLLTDEFALAPFLAHGPVQDYQWLNSTSRVATAIDGILTPNRKWSGGQFFAFFPDNLSDPSDVVVGVDSLMGYSTGANGASNVAVSGDLVAFINGSFLFCLGDWRIKNNAGWSINRYFS